MTRFTITIARAMEQEEIRSNGGFGHVNVIDVRRNDDGGSRPIEEGVLKKLKNHFIGYEQMSMDDSAACDEALMARAGSNNGDTLILADDVAHVARLCQERNIPFTSRSFYVVETGKGDLVRSVVEKQPFQPRFGTFAS